MLDEARGELWSKVATTEDGDLFEIRIPRDQGIAGAVVASGELINISDAYEDDRFDRSVDDASGFRTRSILCLPLVGQEGHVLGVAQILNKQNGTPFDAGDEQRFGDFIAPMGLILESWWRMAQIRDAASEQDAADA